MPSQAESDSRACALAACKRVGLYPASMTVSEFITRRAVELVTVEGLTCPISPEDYTDGLLTFREHFRACLEENGYSGFVVFLQVLCHSEPGQPDTPASWAYWCRYHADRL